MITNKNIIIGQQVNMPTKYGEFKLIPFQETDSNIEHIALIKGTFKPAEVVLTRIHSSCATGDIFGSMRCDCGDQLHKAMEIIEEEGKGVIVYLQQEGRGIGLMNKMQAYKLQEEGYDTVDANIHLGFNPDERDYKIGATILKALNIFNVNLITNNALKIKGLEDNGITVNGRQELIIEPNKHNVKYLKTKQIRMEHMLNFN